MPTLIPCSSNLRHRLKKHFFRGHEPRLLPSQSVPKQHAGFTLIEVLIAMAILVFISYGIYQATVETYRLRDVLGAEGTFYNTIRLAMSIVQRDISLMYSPTVLIPKDKMTTIQQQHPVIPSLPGEDLQFPYQYWSPAINEFGVRPSRMIGTENKLSFVSLSYTRIYRDSPGSEFAKIAYELKREKNDSELKETSILVKTESNNAFNRDDRSDPQLQTFELLHGVKTFKISYLFKDGNGWKTVRTWDSDQDQPRFTFPDLIVIDLEVVGSKQLSFEGRFKFRPEIPSHGLPATL